MLWSTPVSYTRKEGWSVPMAIGTGCRLKAASGPARCLWSLICDALHAAWPHVPSLTRRISRILHLPTVRTRIGVVSNSKDTVIDAITACRDARARSRTETRIDLLRSRWTHWQMPRSRHQSLLDVSRYILDTGRKTHSAMRR